MKIVLLMSLLSMQLSLYAAENTYPDAPAPPKTSLDDDLDCQTKIDLYKESQACFKRYRRLNDSLKEGAYEACEPYKRPNECFDK